MQKYNKLLNETPLIEKMSKGGILQYIATRRVATCTLRKLQCKSVGSVFALQPFYVTYPTEKERLLYLCKFFLINRLIFDSLMTSVDTDSKREFDNSVTKFLMKECDCEKEKVFGH